MYRAIDSHRWNGRISTDNILHPNPIGVQNTDVIPTRDNIMYDRTLVIYRVSRKLSTTENQRYGMDEHIATMPVKPTVLDITDTNWLRPIPAMQRVLAQVKQGQWDYIAVYRTDRLGRRPEFDTSLWYACKNNGCVLHVVEPDLRSDRQEDETKFLRQVADARDEQLLISKRTRLGVDRVRRNVAAGKDTWKWVGRKKGARGKKVASKLATIISALKGGASVRGLSKELGLDAKTIRTIRDDYNLPAIKPKGGYQQKK